MWLQAKECQKLGEGKKGSPLLAPERVWPSNTLILDFWPQNWEKFVCFTHLRHCLWELEDAQWVKLILGSELRVS
jgi:hypothetical protein